MMIPENDLPPAASAGAARHGPDASPSAYEHLYPQTTRELAEERRRLAPQPADAFRAFARSVFADGALSARAKELIAVAVAHVTQCPYCIRSHTHKALLQGSTDEEIMEAIWVAAEMRAGGAYAHSVLAVDTIIHHRSAARENGGSGDWSGRPHSPAPGDR